MKSEKKICKTIIFRSIRAYEYLDHMFSEITVVVLKTGYYI